MGGMVGTLVIGLVIAFKKTLSVPLILLYAVVEGLSSARSASSSPSSTAGTPARGSWRRRSSPPCRVFAGMFLAYKFGLIKVTEKFRRIMTMTDHRLRDLRDRQPRLRARHQLAVRHRRHWGPGIAISIFAVGLASFDARARLRLDRAGHRSGAPQKYSWLLAHGLIVTLVWLYIEFLRLFARLR